MVSHDDYKVPVRPDMLLVATFKKLDSTSTPSTHVMDMMMGGGILEFGYSATATQLP